MVGLVFFNYRQRDDKEFVYKIYYEFVNKLRSTNFFIDLEIPSGSRWRKFIEEKVIESDVVVVAIGEQWSKLLQEKALNSSQEDILVFEIKTALNYGKTIIPILIKDTPIPVSTEFPETIKVLSELQMTRIRDRSPFQQDCDRVIGEVEAELRRRNLYPKIELVFESSVELIDPVTVRTIINQLTEIGLDNISISGRRTTSFTLSLQSSSIIANRLLDLPRKYHSLLTNIGVKEIKYLESTLTLNKSNPTIQDQIRDLLKDVYPEALSREEIAVRLGRPKSKSKDLEKLKKLLIAGLIEKVGDNYRYKK